MGPDSLLCMFSNAIALSFIVSSEEKWDRKLNAWDLDSWLEILQDLYLDLKIYGMNYL